MIVDVSIQRKLSCFSDNVKEWLVKDFRHVTYYFLETIPFIPLFIN
jgi:hypothetical protein